MPSYIHVTFHICYIRHSFMYLFSLCIIYVSIHLICLSAILTWHFPTQFPFSCHVFVKEILLEVLSAIFLKLFEITAGNYDCAKKNKQTKIHKWFTTRHRTCNTIDLLNKCFHKTPNLLTIKYLIVPHASSL